MLKELNAPHRYEAFLSVSTQGGTLNGTTIVFGVDANTLGIVRFFLKLEEMHHGAPAYLNAACLSFHSDDVTIVMIATASGFIVVLLIITMIKICFSKEKW